MSNRRVKLKLRILKSIEIEIRLGHDPFKFTVDSNGLKFELDRNPFNLKNSNILLFIFIQQFEIQLEYKNKTYKLIDK